MLNETIAARVPRALVQRLDDLATATGRRRAEVIRFLLSQASADALPAAWFELADVQRLITGRADWGQDHQP